MKETKTLKAAQAQPSSTAATHGARGVILQQPYVGSPRCSRWRRTRRRSWSAWNGEEGWTMVPCLMNSQACFSSSHPSHYAPKSRQRAGKHKDKAGNVSRTWGALLVSQMAGATRLGVCPRKTCARGGIGSPVLSSSPSLCPPPRATSETPNLCPPSRTTSETPSQHLLPP